MATLNADGFSRFVGAVLEGIPNRGLAIWQELSLCVRSVGRADVVDIIGGGKPVKDLEADIDHPVEAVFDPHAKRETDRHATVCFTVGVSG